MFLLIPFVIVRATADKLLNIYLPGWDEECIFPAVAAQFISLMEPLWYGEPITCCVRSIYILLAGKPDVTQGAPLHVEYIGFQSSLRVGSYFHS